MALSGGGMYAFPPTLDPTWNSNESSRYVTVQAPNKGSLANVNIFLVTKSIQACATVEDIRKNFKAGTYTVRVPNEAQAKQLKEKLTVLGDQKTKVEVVDDEIRNTSRAVISCRDLIGVTEEQIAEELSGQGVKLARHLKKGVNKVETGSVVVTFNKPNPPERLQVACHSIKTRPYYPPPALCYGCFEYGHISKSCKGTEACGNCSGSYHGKNVDCPNPPKCKPCGGSHAATNRECPKRKIEEEIVKMKIDRNITYYEARKLIESKTNVESYAQVAATGSKNTASIEEEKNKWISEIKKKEDMLKVLETKYEKKFEEMINKQSEMDKNYMKQQQCLEQSSSKIEFLVKELEMKQQYINLLEQKVRNLTDNTKSISDLGSLNGDGRQLTNKRDRPTDSEKTYETDSDDSNRSRSPAPKTLAIENTLIRTEDLISPDETIFVEVESPHSMEFDPDSISPNS